MNLKIKFTIKTQFRMFLSHFHKRANSNTLASWDYNIQVEINGLAQRGKSSKQKRLILKKAIAYN